MTMSTLPQDLITNILQRLPVKSLTRFRCVSKPFNTLISDPKFIQMHLNHSRTNQHLIIRSSGLHFLNSDVPSSTPSDDHVVKIDYPFKNDNFGCELMASCDGLLLISPAEDVVCLYNPSTKEFRRLPDSGIEYPRDVMLVGRRTIVYGLGFDRVINDYKVIRVVAFDYGNLVEKSEVKVYTMGTNSWRRIEDFPKTLTYRRVSGELVNGRLHWVVNNFTEEDLVDWDDYDSDEETEWKPINRIVSLGIEDEKYNEVPQPEYMGDEYHLNVRVLGGWLCLLANYHTIRTDVWVMKNYGVKESWTRLFTIAQPTIIPSFDFVLPMKFTKNGEILLVKDNTSLVLYEPRHERAETLAIRGVPNWFEMDTYVESLIPLNSGMHVGKEPAQGTN